MEKWIAAVLLSLNVMSAGCYDDSRGPVSPGETVDNGSYAKLYGVWTSAEGTVQIEDNGMTFGSDFYTYTVSSFNGYGYDVQVSNGERWFIAVAGNTLSIQSGRYKGTYQFSHN